MLVLHARLRNWKPRRWATKIRSVQGTKRNRHDQDMRFETSSYLTLNPSFYQMENCPSCSMVELHGVHACAQED